MKNRMGPISCFAAFVILFAVLVFIFFQFSLEMKSFRVKNIITHLQEKKVRRLQACQSCALFHTGNSPYQGCSWERKVPNLYCSKESSGPYAVVQMLWGGLHNVWMLLVNGLFLSSAWSATGGTLVLPGITSSRNNFSVEEYGKYSTIPMSDIYDLEHMSVYLKEMFNLNVCFLDMYDDDPSARTSPPASSDYLKSLFPNISKEEVISKELLHKKNLDPKEVVKSIDLDDKGVLYGFQGHWTIGSRDTRGEKINSKHLQTWKKAALAVCFSKQIRELSVASINWMRENNPFHRIVGVHIRLESDWNKNNWDRSFIKTEFLSHYENHILKYKKWSPKRISLYVAHGNLTDEVSEIVNEWLSTFNVSIYRKEDTLQGKHGRRFSRLPLEAKAAVDAETLTYLDHFIGYNLSSLSYIVKEKRRYRGKTEIMVSHPDPGYEYWTPVFVPNKPAFISAG